MKTKIARGAEKAAGETAEAPSFAGFGVIEEGTAAGRRPEVRD
jgi:hypothetical protein